MKQKVLIIDSSHMIRITIRRILEEHSLEIIELGTADDLLTMPHKFHDIKLIMLESILPGEHGVTVLEKIKVNDALANIPVIMLVSYLDEITMQRAFRVGAMGFIRKPFTEQSLVSQVNYILGPSDNLQVLYNTVRHEINRAERGQYNFSMVGISIPDNLEPAKQLAVIHRIKATLREIDSVIVDRRLGIILVLPYTRSEKIAVIAERLQQLLDQVDYPQVTFTYVTFPQDGQNEEELVKAVEKISE